MNEEEYLARVVDSAHAREKAFGEIGVLDPQVLAASIDQGPSLRREPRATPKTGQ